MKIKQRYLAGLGAVFLTYGILAYIFMWPPVVRYISWKYFPKAMAVSVSNPCVNNLRQIDAAITEWALTHGKHNGDPVTFADIKPYIKLTSEGEIPSCPDGGTYSVTVVGRPPTCSLATNIPTRIRAGCFYWKWSYNTNNHILP
jgi:hypothetical protein